MELEADDVLAGDKVTIVGRNLPVTEAMREHILDKVHKIEAITPQVLNVIVYLEIQRSTNKVEIIYKFSHFLVVTHAVMDDMYQAIDLACVRLRRKLEKWKTRIQSHHGKKLSEALMDVHVLDRQKEDLYDINDQIEDATLKEMEKELRPPKIVNKKQYSIPMLTLDEAAMRIELSDLPFLVFKSEEDQKLKVIYVRRNKTIGLLELE